MSWVEASFDFGLTWARLVMPADRAGSDLFRIAVARLHGSPLALAEVVTDIVVAQRPDLAGGRLFALRFDHERARWECLYAHPSLPVVRLGEMGPVVDLTEPAPHVVTGGPTT